MESIPNARISNARRDGGTTGGQKLGLDTNTSPSQHPNSVSSPITSPVTSPPYWVSSHQRSVSNISVESVPTGAITLQDNTDCEDAKTSACWAKSVYIEDHVVVNERRTSIGAFVIWIITVETLRVCSSLEMCCCIIYWLARAHPFEFENDTPNSMTFETNYHKHSPNPERLSHLFPRRVSYPNLDRSSWNRGGLVYNTFSSKYLATVVDTGRMLTFSSCILLNPEFSGSPIVKEFLFE